MILRTSLLLLPVLALAQQQAPPEVDQELRARVTAFYQNFVETSFSPRKAEQFVAEDTKDWFYNALKQKYQSFQILKITYSDDFKTAVVVVSAKMETTLAGQRIVADFPKDTKWKIENGKWCWTFHQEEFPVTPMSVGAMNPPVSTGTEPRTAGVVPKNSSPEAMRAAGMEVLKQQEMGVDKSLVTFTADQPASAQVVFTNGADGEIQIALDGPVVRGLKAKLDKMTIPGHGTAVLSLQYDPSDKSGPKDVWEPKGNIPFRIVAAPFDRMFAVNVQFIGPK
jgi:hypothetical protein